MAMLETIKLDWMTARKAHDSVRANVLGTLLGAIQTRQKLSSAPRDLTDAEVIAEVKKMLDAVIETGKLIETAADREHQRSQNAVERATLEAYMPQQMSDAEIEAFVTAKAVDGANMGAIMAALKSERAGMYDGKLASVIVKRVLAAPIQERG